MQETYEMCVQFLIREDPLERRAWQPTPVFLPGESLDRGAWQAVVPGMTELDVTEHTQALADSDAHSH